MLIKFNHDFYLNTDRIEAIHLTIYTDEQIKAKQDAWENKHTTKIPIVTTRRWFKKKDSQPTTEPVFNEDKESSESWRDTHAIGKLAITLIGGHSWGVKFYTTEAMDTYLKQLDENVKQIINRTKQGENENESKQTSSNITDTKVI